MAKRLNYSKWDQLEVSDDSDIEGHPNVDHKSLVRWKQRDIHEKRAQRKQKIAQLEAEIACNAVVLTRLGAVLDDVRAGGPERFSSTVERLKMAPAPDKPETSSPNQPTYDAMVEASLVKVWEALKDKGVEKSDERLGEKLVKGLEEHIAEFRAHDDDLKKQVEQEHAESGKKITSEDMHEGWDSKYVPAKPAPPPLVATPPAKKEKKVEYETLNPKGVAASAAPAQAAAAAKEAEDDDDEDDDEDEDDAPSVPDMTPDLLAFAKIRVRDYTGLYEFIQKHRSVVVRGASDALLLEAFSAQSRGQNTYAKQCVQQSLVLQYADKLGGDGVRVFFQRMLNTDPRAEGVFSADLDQTYKHLSARAAIIKAEAAASSEQIQLVAQDPSQKITFNVPDGPPPEHLELEGPGAEGLEIEQVRAALQMRWDIFCGFDVKLQDALRSGSLERVNKVLGRMPVPDAEQVVEALNMGGILSFADDKIRDVTGNAEEPAEKK